MISPDRLLKSVSSLITLCFNWFLVCKSNHAYSDNIYIYIYEQIGTRISAGRPTQFSGVMQRNDTQVSKTLISCMNIKISVLNTIHPVPVLGQTDAGAALPVAVCG